MKETIESTEITQDISNYLKEKIGMDLQEFISKKWILRKGIVPELAIKQGDEYDSIDTVLIKAGREIEILETQLLINHWPTLKEHSKIVIDSSHPGNKYCLLIQLSTLIQTIV